MLAQQPVRKAALVLCIILPVFAVASVCLRFYARRAKKLPLLADDWSVALALIATVVASILTFYGIVAKGLGLGPAELPPQDQKTAYKIFYAIMLLIFLDLGVIKISFVLFYKRLFVGPRFSVVCNIMMATITAWTIAQFIIQALNSWNTPGFWNDKLLNYNIFNISMAVLDFTFDISILLLPVPCILRLKMDSRRKYYLIAMFWLGSICVIASSLRIYYTYEFLHIGPEASDERITYISTSNSLWLAIEANMSIIAACLPTLGGFLKGRLESRSSRYLNNDVKYQHSSYPNSDKKPRKRSATLSGDDSRDDWIPLQDVEFATTIANTDGRSSVNHGKGIFVKTTFTSENQPV